MRHTTLVANVKTQNNRAYLFSRVFLAMVLALVFAGINANAQTLEPGTEAYASAKDAGLVEQISLALDYDGESPNVQHYLDAAAARGAGCFIPHDPMTWTNFPGNDDGSEGPIALPFSFDLYGDTYSSIYLNNNGNLTFGNSLSSFTPDGFPISTPMIAPFWGDVDTRNGRGEVWYYLTDHALYVNWVEVGVFSADNPDLEDLRNTFQVIITDGTDAVLEPGNNIAFHYEIMDWTTGDASLGELGFGGAPATVGVNAGNNVDFIQIGRFGTDTNDYDGPDGEVDGVNWLEFQCFQFNVSSGTNFPPIAQNLPVGNEINICNDESATLDLGFIGPEGDQTVTVAVSSGDSYTLNSNDAGNPAEVSVTFEGLAPGSYSYDFIATDNGDPVGETTVTITVNVEDCTGECEPNLMITCPEDMTVECGSDLDPMSLGMPMVDADDCYAGSVDITYMDDVISENGCEQMIARTWMASADDETDMCTQMITVIDTEAPVLNMPPLYYSLEWSVYEGNFIEDFLNGQITLEDLETLSPLFNEQLEAQGYFYPTASDACDDDVTPYYIQSILGPEELECPLVAEVIWSFYAQDDCGNVTGPFDVVCEFFDTTPPEFIDFPEDVLVQCIEDVPAPEAVNAEDACADVVSVDIFTSETGFPTDSCVATTAFGPGDDWALWLPVLETEGLSPTDDFVPVGELAFVKYNDGTARLTGSVVNDENPAQGWDIDLHFENQATWAEWEAMGRSYKDDLGLAAAGGNLWTTWDYYELVNGFSTLTGTGDFSGDVLYLDHMPSSYYFGFQCGEAANNRNSNFGMSGWFTYSGFIGGEAVEGHGDVNVDKECVPTQGQECVNDDEFTYYYRAEDSCGNVAFESYTVTVNDTTAPEFTVVPEDITVECDEVPVPVFEGVEAIDNCECGVESIVYIGETLVDGGNDCLYQLERTWAAFDCCGNRADYVQTITVEDTTAPEVTYVPADVTYECDEEILVELAEGVDNCQDVEVTYEDSIEEGDCPQEYTITRTFYLSDGCDNVSTATQTISVVDTTAPVFGDYEVSVSVECTEVDEVEGPDATDNCGEVTITYEDQLQSGGCLGVIVRTYTAVDECGNEVTTEQYITILDTTPPVIENPADMTVECDEVPATPGADGIDIYDNCGEEVEVTFTEEIIDGLCEDSYTIVWTWTATDYCENMSEASTTITVQDTTNPVFVEVPEDVTYECDEEVPACSSDDVVAEDNCDNDVVVECEDQIIDGDCPQEYTIQRIYRAFDNCGNQAIYVQNISVVDTTAPMFPELAELTYECDEEIPVILPDATDNCGAVTVTYEDSTVDGECPQEYTITRTYTAEDECGNTSSTSQTINVVDTTAPVFDEYSIEVEAPCDNADVAILTATDNCGEVTVTYEDTPVSGGCAGIIIRDYVAVDECGNEATAQQIITLVDEVAPVFVEVPADMTYECDQEVPACSSDDVAVEDNCTEVEVSCADVTIDGECPQEYTIERTYTAEDNCGNISTYTQTITVVDTTAPEFTEVPADATYECDEEIPAINAEAEDNCGEVTVTWEDSIADGDCPQEYTITRTFTAMDECGNSSTETQTITVVDTTAPEFTMVPADVTYECDEEVLEMMAEASDNCGEVTVTYTDDVADGNCPQEYTITRTFTAEDECGNASTATQTINVVDTTAPVFDEYPIQVDVPCDEVDVMTITATDNCGEVTITYTEFMISGGCAGSMIRDYVAVDECGNEAYAQQIISLVDEVAPEAENVPADATFECDEEIILGEPTFTDNCDDDLEITYNEVTEELDCFYQIIRTWTAIDHCDNETTVSQVITVTDTTAPSIEAGDDLTIECTAIIPDPSFEVSDNCDEDVMVDITSEMFDGDCPQEYTMVRTYTATDDCGNVSVDTQTITVVDTTAPVFTEVAEDVTVECDEELPAPFASAEDNCGEVTIEVSPEIIDGDCGNEYTMVRTYTATDECGNASTATQTITVVDTTAPEFTNVPSSITVECLSDVPDMMTLAATDNCGDAEVVCNEVSDLDDCGNGVIIRTCTATDACGNTTQVSYSITINDTTAPTLNDLPEENLVIDCEDDVPAPADVTATDNCDNDLEVIFTEEIIGDLPAEGSSADCVATTPEAYFEGETCGGTDPWSLVLFNFGGEEAALYSTIEANWVEYPDGTATLTGSVFCNDNPDAGWEINVAFENGMPWTEWSTQGFPTGYKDDCDIAGDNFLDWMYYIMSEGATLTGWGDYEGATLNLDHAPSNLYYGYQVGVAANNVNENYGSGGWFTYSGEFNGDEVYGSGDFAFDHDCCPQYSVERTWCVTDCSGNETCFTQLISFDDLSDDNPLVDLDFEEMAAERGDFEIVRLSPNPAESYARVEVMAYNGTPVRIELVDLNGKVVDVIFEGDLSRGQTFRTIVNTNNLYNGVYTVRAYSQMHADVTKLVIQK